MRLRATNCIPFAQMHNARDTRPFHFFKRVCYARLGQGNVATTYVIKRIQKPKGGRKAGEMGLQPNLTLRVPHGIIYLYWPHLALSSSSATAEWQRVHNTSGHLSTRYS